MSIAIVNIIILLFAFVVTLLGLLKENQDHANQNLLKVLLTLTIVGLGLSVLAQIMSYREQANEQSARAKEANSIIERADTTLRRVDANLRVSDSILGVSKTSIEQLTALQRTSAGLTEDLAKELEIQKETNQETKHVLKQSQEIKANLTGGNSVPVVQSNLRLFLNPRAEYVISPLAQFEGQTIIDFSIVNYGEYPLTNIRAFVRTFHLRQEKEEEELPVVQGLRPGESKILIPTTAFRNDYFDPFVYSIRVKWKVEYTYRVAISNTMTQDKDHNPIMANVYTKSESYEYKGRQYQTADELVSAIRKDL